MRRLITTLAILLVVIVAGMSALVLLVNPNDFRAYMVQQVEQRSGYTLALDGELRWHVWPKLSILSGRMSITAPGASQPLVSAENMRLDVNLLPLLSHQLSVKQVMVKNAVMRVTPDSAAQRPTNAPVGPSDSTVAEPVSGWKLDIGQLQIADSLLIWQQAGGEEINFRDINLELKQDEHRQAQIELSTRVSRDQRELQLAIKGAMDVSRYPQRLTATVEQFDWQLQGVGLPSQGLQGETKLLAEWQQDRQQFALKNIALSVNNSQLTGAVSGKLGATPDVNLDLQATTLDLDALLGQLPDAVQGAQGEAVSVSARAPVIAEPVVFSYRDSPLNSMTAQLKLRADALRWRGMDMTQVQLDARNQQGDITLATFSGKFGNGDFSLPGTLNLRGDQLQVALQPELHDIDAAPLLKALELPETLSGRLSLDADLRGAGLSIADMKQQWRGTASFSVANAQLSGLNFQQMIQRAVENSSDQVRGSDSPEGYTAVQQLQGNMQLNKGALVLQNLRGHSELLDLNGNGNIDLVRQQCDVTFNIKVISGWQGNSQLVQTLTTTAIPLRLYGGWDSLQYSLQVDQLLRKRLQDEAKSRLNEWLQNNPPQPGNKSSLP
ncbi:outer membrane assembly protein AsmA [Erwinia sp. V71]|uniref:outer membrane assembly protein AsmA n=1 Tax=Erwinia sp. V71 TaxID=3369424 RepID=UPI003F62BF75